MFAQYNTSSEFANLVNEYAVKYPSLTENYILSEANKVMKDPSSKGKVEENLSFYQNTTFIDYRTLNNPYQWSPWLTMAGEGLITTPDAKTRAAGYVLLAPEATINLFKGTNEIAKGNVYEGVQYIGASAITLAGAYQSYQTFKPSTVNSGDQTTQKLSPDLLELHSTLDSLAEEHLLPQYRKTDPDLTAGYVGSFKTGIVGNPNKTTYGQSINLNNYDIDYYIKSDKLYEMYGNSLKANVKFREILCETPGFVGLNPDKNGFSIKFIPSETNK